MSLVRYEPVNYFNRFRKDMDRLFGSMGGLMSSFDDEEDSSIVTSQWAPAVDIREEDHQFVINADIPGVPAKDIEVSMENNMLTIKGERSTESKEDRGNYRRIERSHGMFYRRFSLPDTADSGHVKARGKNGVLEITIAKREAAKPHRIAVQS